MGAHSTIRISRKAARKAIMSKAFDGLSDVVLEHILDRLLDCRLYEVAIHGEEDAEDDELLNDVMRVL